MPSNFPTSLDTLSNPASTDQLSNVTTPHASQHANANDILEAVEAKLGLGASTPPASAAVLRRTGTGSSGWAQVAAGDYAAGSIVNADVNGSAAIAYSKLNLANSVATADLVANAASQSGSVNVATGATVVFGGALVDIAGAFVDLTVQASGEVLVAASMSVSNSNAGVFAYLALTYDAVAAAAETPTVFPGASQQIVVSTIQRFSGLSAGTRRFKAQWRGSLAGTTTLYCLQMTAVELKR